MENKSQLAGIFSIVSGAIGVITSLGLFLFAAFMVLMFSNPYYFERDVPPESFSLIMATVYILSGIVSLLISVLAIVGGAYSLKKKYWGLALAGAIGATLAFWPLGIAAIVFTALGKEESAAKGTPPAA
jgi:hypothetical protein